VLAHIHPSSLRFAPWLVGHLPLSTRLRHCVLWWYPSPIAMAESPFALLGRYPVRGRVPTISVGVARPSSLLWAHAPDHVPPTFFGCPSIRGSRQVAASLCCDVVLPDVISAHLSPRAWTPTPAARVVHMPVSSHTTSAFPPLGPSRRSTISPPATSGGTPISGLQSFTDVQARRFAHHPGRSYRYGSSVWQPWFLRPSHSWFVASPRPGYANRPNRAIDTFHRI
jgi:hypothetical protein